MRRRRAFVPLVVMAVLTVGAGALAIEQSPARSVGGGPSTSPGATPYAKVLPSATSAKSATSAAAAPAPGSDAAPVTTTTAQAAVTVVGMTVAEATAVQLRTGRHPVVEVQREVVEPSVAPGTIVSEGGVGGAGEPAPPPSGLVEVTVGVSPAPPCTATQLALAYLGGQTVDGGDSGFLVVRDTSAQWCSLNGPVEVWGQAATGRIVTDKLAEPIPVPIVMSPRTSTPAPFLSVTSPGTSPGVLQAAVEFADDEDGCLTPDPAEPTTTVRVVPATLDLSIPGGVVLTTPNRSYAKEGTQRFTACGGHLATPPAPTAVSVRG